MRFRRQYTLFQRTRNGKKYWYFRIYLPDGTRKAKSTGCRSKEKATCYVETLLDNESKLRVVFETDIKQSAKNSKGLGSGSITTLKTFENIILFSDFAEGWWEWDSCPYVLDRRSAGTEEHPGIKKKYDFSPFCSIFVINCAVAYFRVRLSMVKLNGRIQLSSEFKDKEPFCGTVKISSAKSSVKAKSFLSGETRWS